jgi:ring-1,2-phenylacetyl-CoA epoxidase subunit PaaE
MTNVARPTPPDAAVSVTRIPDPSEPVPDVAWPTLALLAGGLALFAGSSAAAVGGLWPWPISAVLNAAAIYVLFTVAHDASHHSASSSSTLNTWMGRVAIPFLSPVFGFGAFRFIHMQHHRFTNHDDGRDPDHYTMQGTAWQRLPRFATLDLAYLRFYWTRRGQRRRREFAEIAVQLALFIALAAWLIAAGHGVDLALLYLVPQRMAIVFLAWAFDYLPHSRLHHTPAQDRLKTTRNRIGGEWWASPVMLYQNYHLVHHLHPVVPFYKYLVVWRRNEKSYLEGDPALTTLRGRPITAEEYRQMRRLVEEHG